MRRPDRVVITGIGLTCPIGSDLTTVTDGLRVGRSGIRAMPQWVGVRGLGPSVAGVVTDVDLKASIPRKYRRSMGRVAQLATYATGQAIREADLSRDLLAGGRVGLASGSTTGSPSATLEYYANILGEGGIRANKSTAFLQVMSHTCAANLAMVFGITGRVWGANSACTSASQAIGLGFDTLRAGLQDVMVCGGAEEAHATTAGVFDVVHAASTAYNGSPTKTPRPFDRDRDGMVVGEGAGTLVLERLAHARARGARIYGEVVGFGTTCDGEHITSPAAAGMVSCMRAALADAHLKPDDMDYINAHATATALGDATEAEATRQVFADRVPISSTKGYVGHTLGACGAIETIFLVSMMQNRYLAPTLNLDNIDPACEGLRHVTDRLDQPMRIGMTNNFAFGGINTSLIIRRTDEHGNEA